MSPAIDSKRHLRSIVNVTCNRHVSLTFLESLIMLVSISTVCALASKPTVGEVRALFSYQTWARFLEMNMQRSVPQSASTAGLLPKIIFHILVK